MHTASNAEQGGRGRARLITLTVALAVVFLATGLTLDGRSRAVEASGVAPTGQTSAGARTPSTTRRAPLSEAAPSTLSEPSGEAPAEQRAGP